MKRICATWIG